MIIDAILKLLDEEFERMIELFEKEDWQFYKFGQGGPYKRTLTHLMDKSKKYDVIINDHFGYYDEIATFNKLTVLCLSASENKKQRDRNINEFRQKIERMKIII